MMAIMKSKGGHVLIHLNDIKGKYDVTFEDTIAKDNILGVETDAVMLVLFAEWQ